MTPGWLVDVRLLSRYPHYAHLHPEDPQLHAARTPSYAELDPTRGGERWRAIAVPTVGHSTFRKVAHGRGVVKEGSCSGEVWLSVNETLDFCLSHSADWMPELQIGASYLCWAAAHGNAEVHSLRTLHTALPLLSPSRSFPPLPLPLHRPSLSFAPTLTPPHPLMHTHPCSLIHTHLCSLIHRSTSTPRRRPRRTPTRSSRSSSCSRPPAARACACASTAGASAAPSHPPTSFLARGTRRAARATTRAMARRARPPCWRARGARGPCWSVTTTTRTTRRPSFRVRQAAPRVVAGGTPTCPTGRGGATTRLWPRRGRRGSQARRAAASGVRAK